MMSFNGELLEIFSWLPARHLHKFSSVCKSSFELVPNDFFARKQFKHMQLLGDTDYFIEPNNYIQRCVSNKLEARTLCSNDSFEENTIDTLPKKSLEFLANTSRILASSNGLLCCRNVGDDDNPLFLFNPVTRSYMSIPSPHKITSSMDFNIVFACEKEEDRVDYLLMALLCPDEWSDHGFHTKIYSAEENIWRDGERVDLGARAMVYESSVYVNGVVYMMSTSYLSYFGKQSPFYWPYIVAYENKKPSSKFLKIPKGARKGIDSVKLRMFKWGKPNSSSETICLVRLFKNAFTVWVLKNNRWNMVFKRRVKAMGVQLDSDCDTKVAHFTVMNGGVLLFATLDKVYRYDLVNGKGSAEFQCMHEYGDSVCLTSFSSTLRPSGSNAITLKSLF